MAKLTQAQLDAKVNSGIKRKPKAATPEQILEQKRVDGVQAQIDSLRAGIEELLVSIRKDNSVLVESIKKIQVNVDVQASEVSIPEYPVPLKIKTVHVRNVTRDKDQRLETADIDIQYIKDSHGG